MKMMLFLCYNETKKDKNMTKKLLTLLLALLFTGCFSNEKSSDEKVLEKQSSDSNSTKKVENNQTIVKKEPLFTLTTINGDKLNIDELSGGLNIREFKDKVVLFIFFGHRCPPCLAEIPALAALTKKKHKDLEIVGLEVQGLVGEKLETFIKNRGINYHIISGENSQPFISYIAEKAGWTGAIPFLLAMDKKGVVQIVHAGGLGKAQLDNIYNELRIDKKIEKEKA